MAAGIRRLVHRPLGLVLLGVLGFAGFATAAVTTGMSDVPPSSAPVRHLAANGTNPDLKAGCGLNLILVLDESYSIQVTSGAVAGVRAAANAFVSGLSGTGSKLAIVEFNGRARISIPYTTVTDASKAGTFTPYINGTAPAGNEGIGRYDPSYYTGNDRYTNWDDGLLKARGISGGTKADMVVFLTDGDPTASNTYHGQAQESETGPNQFKVGATPFEPTALPPAITHANELKNGGTHMFVVGVGEALTSSASQQRLQDVSGPDRFDPANPNATPFPKSDYTLIQDFGKLESAMRSVVTELCKGSVTVTKHVDANRDGKFDEDPSGWKFTGKLSLSAGSYQWLQPVPPPTTGERTVTVGKDGVATFQWNPDQPSATATFTLTEADRQGYQLASVKCANGSTPIAGVTTLPATITLKGQEYVTCDVYNVALPTVTLCHATGDTDKPYTQVDAKVLPDGTLDGGHLTHTGPIFPEAGWGDIIPPYVDGKGQAHAGLNDTAAGLAFLQNDCQPPIVVPEKPLTPVLECVEPLDAGGFLAHFGYDNENSALVSLPISSYPNVPAKLTNEFAPAPENRGQPTDFEPGTHSDVFQVQLGSNEKITWTLNGNEASASSDSKECKGSISVVKRLEPATDPGRFNLKIDGVVKAENVGHDGTTGTIAVAATPKGTSHEVSESAFGDTSLDNYTKTIDCREDDGTVVASGDGPSLAVVVKNGQAVICTITNTREVEEPKVRPFVQCVHFADGAPVSAVWGYENDNAVTVTVPVGDRNAFAPSGHGGDARPTDFQSGRHYDVFTTPFLDAGELTWTLTGNTATATSGSTDCEPVPPEECPPEGTTTSTTETGPTTTTEATTTEAPTTTTEETTTAPTTTEEPTTTEAPTTTVEALARARVLYSAHGSQATTDTTDTSDDECPPPPTTTTEPPPTTAPPPTTTAPPPTTTAPPATTTTTPPITTTPPGTTTPPETTSPTPPQPPPTTTAPPVTTAPPPPPPPATKVDLSIVKIADPATVSVGQNIVWHVTVKNESKAPATNVIVHEPFANLPAGLVFVSVHPSQGGCDDTSCELGVLAPGASATIRIVTTGTRVGPVANTARVSADERDPNEDNNTASAVARVIGPLRPPVVNNCRSLDVAPRALAVGRTAVVIATARNPIGGPIHRLRLHARGHSINLKRRTDARGIAIFVFTPKRQGIVFIGPVKHSGLLRSRTTPRHPCRAPIGVFRPAEVPPVTG